MHLSPEHSHKILRQYSPFSGSVAFAEAIVLVANGRHFPLPRFLVKAMRRFLSHRDYERCEAFPLDYLGCFQQCCCQMLGSLAADDSMLKRHISDLNPRSANDKAHQRANFSPILSDWQVCAFRQQAALFVRVYRYYQPFPDLCDERSLVGE